MWTEYFTKLKLNTTVRALFHYKNTGTEMWNLVIAIRESVIALSPTIYYSRIFKPKFP